MKCEGYSSDCTSFEQSYERIRKKRIIPMRQIYFCPNCRGPIGYSDRFCGNCGVNLKWEIRQIPPESLPLTYDCLNPGREQASSSQQLQYNQPPFQTSVARNPNQTQQRYVATSSEEHSSSGGAVTPLSAEVSKLLEDFFDKRAKCTR